MTTSPAPFPARRPLVPEDLLTPAEALIRALAGAARAAACGDAQAAQTIKLILEPRTVVAVRERLPAKGGATAAQPESIIQQRL
jgi:hypothetical protein